MVYTADRCLGQGMIQICVCVFMNDAQKNWLLDMVLFKYTHFRDFTSFGVEWTVMVYA
jgi:hypothetical protein